MHGQGDLEQAADELYSRAPDEFTAARNAKVRDARAAGDLELAEGLRILHKPSVAAWLANVLVRERAREITDLLTLGAALREAQASFDGEALRRLSEERRKVVDTLSREARRLARERGRTVSNPVVRDLEGTLEAGLLDPAAAEQLQRGRLTGALAYSGVGFPSPLSTPPSSPTSVASPGRSRAATVQGTRTRTPMKGKTELAAGPRVTFTSALRQAQLDARDARRAAARASTALTSAERATEREKAALSAAQAELTRRREIALGAQRALARARAGRDAAEREVRRAEQRLEATRRAGGTRPLETPPDETQHLREGPRREDQRRDRDRQRPR